MKVTSAAEANRRFSALLREVAQGEEVMVLAHGKPVAMIAPAEGTVRDRRLARAALLARLRRLAAGGARDWTRDELYERKPCA